MKLGKSYGFIAALLVLGASTAAEPNIKELQDSAASVDELVLQKKQKVRVFSSGATGKKTEQPLELSRVAAIAGKKLNIEQQAIREVLADERQKLSKVVYAKQIAVKTGRPWRSILDKNSEEALLGQLQANDLVAVQKIMDNLLAELSFAALDQMDPSQAIGQPAGTATGTDTSEQK